jgi:hypothetical protein
VFVLGQATKDSIFERLFATIHLSASFKGAVTISSAFANQAPARRLVALNTGVMRRFERVVALPYPKDIEIPQPQQHFLQLCSDPVSAIE